MQTNLIVVHADGTEGVLNTIRSWSVLHNVKWPAKLDRSSKEAQLDVANQFMNGWRNNYPQYATADLRIVQEGLL